MKKLALLLLLLASAASAQVVQVHMPTLVYGTPVPGTGDPAGVCDGEVCVDGDLLEWDNTDECFHCISNTQPVDCTGTGVEFVGPVYFGEGAVDPCDGCAVASTGDVVVRGGELLFTATNTLIAPCTLDAADTKAVIIAGGGQGGTPRGATFTLYGNEHGGGLPGAIIGRSGATAGAGVVFGAHPTDANGGLTFSLDSASSNDAEFIIYNGGFQFSGTTGGATLVRLEEDVDFLLDGDTADAFKTTLGPAPGLAASTLFRTPATNGAAGNVLGNADGSGQSAWVTRPVSVMLSTRTETCAACPAATTELVDDATGTSITQTKFDTAGFSNVRLIATLDVAATAADIFLQCDTDSAFGSATDQATIANPAVDLNVGSYIALSGECVAADVYWRVVTKNGNTLEAPVFVKLEAQFK